MIITSIKADNFRKFKTLFIDTLPARGLIALAGHNESGKSTIGDAIVFALYGQTDQLKAYEAAKLIRWGADQATVTLRMQHRGHEYRLVRSINQAGHTMVQLFSTEEEITLADTPETVARQLQTMLGYHYDSFLKSFYWSRQSTRNADSDTELLLSIVGLKEHARLNTELQNENQERRQLIDQQENQRQQTLQSMDAMQIDKEHLPHLQQMSQELASKQQQLTQLGQRIDQEAGLYPDYLQRYQQVQHKGHSAGLWTKISIVVFFLTLLAGVILLYQPAWGTNLLTSLDASTQDQLAKGAIRLASLAAIIAAGFLIYGWYIDARLQQPLHRQAAGLVATFQEGYDACSQAVSQQVQSKTAQYLSTRHPDLPAASSDQVDLAKVPKWIKAATSYETAHADLLNTADILNHGLASRKQEIDRYQERLKTDISAEQQRLQQYDKLQKVLDKQESKLGHDQRDFAVFNTAVDLIQKDARHSIERFNQLLRTHCPELLNRFTHSHYKALEINPDFSLKVVSQEKGDFLDFNETSAGTQRQIALAMQIALANALADTTKTDTQMLFLDEPFAFFDPQRTQDTLQSLLETSQGPVSQIWLTSQTVPQGVKFARVIQCPQGENVLQA